MLTAVVVVQEEQGQGRSVIISLLLKLGATEFVCRIGRSTLRVRIRLRTVATSSRTVFDARWSVIKCAGVVREIGGIFRAQARQ
jgi:hypothetical protein